MFCGPERAFDGTEGVRSRFQVLRARTHFWRYRRRRLLFSCFARQTHFRRFRGHRVSFSHFSRTDSFPTVPRVSGPVFKFCAPGLIFGGTAVIGSRFHVLRARTRFRRYRGCRLRFSSFALPDSFSAVARAWTLVFMFCAPRLIFGGTEGVGSYFNVSRARTRSPR
jgi:hypothetical protein